MLMNDGVWEGGRVVGLGGNGGIDVSALRGRGEVVSGQWQRIKHGRCAAAAAAHPCEYRRVPGARSTVGADIRFSSVHRACTLFLSGRRFANLTISYIITVYDMYFYRYAIRQHHFHRLRCNFYSYFTNLISYYFSV